MSTGTYRVEYTRAAAKELGKIAKAQARRIMDAVDVLATNPRPQGSRKLTGRDAWRIRVGAYRVIYEVDDDTVLVTVVRVGHRRDVYRET